LSEVFLIIARDIQEFIGGEAWMEKMKAVPDEQEFREWEAEGIATIVEHHISLFMTIHGIRLSDH
jgi:hypothetical protein